MIAYFIKTVICSGLLLLIYKLLLEKETFHSFKRAYLLICLVICFLIPLIEVEITSPSETLTQVSPLAESDQPIIGNHQPSAEIQNTPVFFTYGVLIIYGLITGLLLVRFAKNVVGLCRTISQNEKLLSEGLMIVLLNCEVIPHSFLGYVFLNRGDFKNSRIEEEILIHERVHVRQRHSLDVLFIELLQAFFWFNPFLAFYKQAIKLNHEFLADASVVRQTKNAPFYQQLLLSKMGSPVAALCSEINYSITKKRFLMMTRTTKNWVAYCKALSLIPILAGIVFLLSTKVVAQQTAAAKESHLLPKSLGSFFADTKQDIILEADTIIYHTTPSQTKINALKALFIVNGQRMDASILMKKTIVSKELLFYSEGDPDAIQLYGEKANTGVIVFRDANIVDVPMRTSYKEIFEKANKAESNPQNMIFTEVEVQPQFAGGENAWQQYLQKNLKTSIPLSNKAPNGKYIVEVQFIVGLDGSISNIKALSQNGFGMEEEAIRIVKSSPKWMPATQNGHQVQAYKKQTVIFDVK